jgi:hypothetical protein
MSRALTDYTAQIRPCAIHSERFRWDIVHLGHPIASSFETFGTKFEALNAGLDELEKLQAMLAAVHNSLKDRVPLAHDLLRETPLSS